MSMGQEPFGGDDPAKRLEQEAEKLEVQAERIEEEAKELKANARELEEEAKELEEKRTVTVIFNEKYRVKVQGAKQTGHSLKEAAINEGVPIQLDFVLSIELGGGKTEIIGNDQTIVVKDGDRFLAIPDDDNS